MTDEFSRFHPLVNLIFYVAVLGISMFQMQAGLIVISFVCGCVYHFCLKKREGLKYMGMIVFVFIVSAMINPMFSHKGSTLLFYLFTGNPVTLESVIYGMAAAGIICAVLLWFSSFNVIMTEDKLLAVVGTIMPHVAMLLAMVFRFVPKLVRQGKSVADANKALGMKTKGLKNKIKTQMDIFSITATWALENSVDTADSMKARGYGAGKRTSYNNYKIEMRDVAVILWIVILSATVCIGIGKGAATTYYYPVIQIKNNILVYISYTALCITPILIDIREAVRWHRLRLKI